MTRPDFDAAARLPADASALSAPLLPVASAEEGVAVVAGEDDIRFVRGTRHYRVRGLARNTSAQALKVTLRVSAGERVHLDTLDVYQARSRAAFAKVAAIELGVNESVMTGDLSALLLALEPLHEAAIRGVLHGATAEPVPALSAAEETAGLALLRDPTLVDRIVSDVGAIGVVGEATNALVGYLACVSRLLAKPLAILIQSTSAAGKSTLMDALLSLMPEPERVHYSAMTGQSLFYIGEGDLKHKILAIAEEEGVRQAAYALKLLQSQGELTIASTGKDPTTGKLVTSEYRVEGPVMLCLTTTAIDIDEELLNRCLVLTINESAEQTRAIQDRQRASRTLAGLQANVHSAQVLAAHRAAQTLLRPLAVVNPFAETLTFASDRVRLRRDHQKYLALIDAIALLHQQQRPIKTLEVSGAAVEYVEVTVTDIQLANRLAHAVLGRSLDELPPQTRRVLAALDTWTRARAAAQGIEHGAVRFTRREVRGALGFSDTQLRVHLERLVELEYVIAHGGRQGQRIVYELLFDGDTEAEAPQLIGLMDETSRGEMPTSRGKTATSRGSTPYFAGGLRGDSGPVAAPSRGAESARKASNGNGSASLPSVLDENARDRTPRQRRNGAAVAGVEG